MRDSVVIDGVTLTREQIEEAQRKLNAPKPVVVNTGDVVALKGGGYAYFVQDAKDGYWLQPNGKRAYGSGTLPEHIVRVGTFSEIVAFYMKHHQEAK